MPQRQVERWIVVITAIALTLSGIKAQDACIALLQHGIYDTHSAQGSTQTFASFKSNFCSWYSSYRQTHQSAGASLTIPIVDIPIGLSGNMTYGEADAMQQGLCSSQASTSSLDQTWAQIDRTLNAGGTQAFVECVKALKGGLNVDFRVNDDDSIVEIGLAYNSPLGAGPATLNKISNPGWICDPPSQGIDLHSIVNKPGRLSNSQLGMTCKRDIKQAPFIVGAQKVVADRGEITLQSTAGMFTAFFKPKLFEDPIADTAKVLASYPKGTILPFAGHLENIPAGWHICDGTSGTVNLVDYIPYGARTNDQIDAAAHDQHEGNRQHSHTVPDTDPPFRGFNQNVSQGDRGFIAMGNDTQHHIGRTGPENNLPAVTRVFFIQKIN